MLYDKNITNQKTSTAIKYIEEHKIIYRKKA